MAKKRSKRASKTSAAKGKRKGKARAAPTERRAQPKGVINAWEDDPGAGMQPSGGQVIQRPIPVLRDQPLPIRIVHPARAPEAKPHAPGTAEFRYWTAAEALRRGADFWGALLPGLSWEVGSILPVDLDFGVDLNAFYDRVGLKFFHATAAGRTVFSGESPDVVCHELGHALLDSFKPQLFDAASIEVAAFHESFGDMSAVLSALQLPSVREGVLAETGGVLRRSSRLSRVAEQLGSVRQSVPSAVEPDCLRNAVNTFFYRDPDTLPTTAPATSLSSESHSFSRVFTGAFFEGLAGMLATTETRDEAALLQVSQDMGAILVQSVRAASVVPTFFSQVAASMLAVAASRFSAQGYEAPLRSGFVRHGILPPSMAVAATQAPAQLIAAAASSSESKTLPTLQLSVAEYGLGVPSIVVYAAAEPKRLQVTGAALAVGAAPSPGEDQAAKSFFEDLLRRGRLKVPKAAKSAAEVVRAAAPSTHESHTHELRREGRQMVLRRVRIDCAFAHH
jgi:hypothetical protein